VPHAHHKFVSMIASCGNHQQMQLIKEEAIIIGYSIEFIFLTFFIV
jgi:hypothetical protein